LWKSSTTLEFAMPLHDWNQPKGWEGVHTLWITELLRWIKPRLPEGYRAYIGSTPAPTVSAAAQRPDEEIATLSLEPHAALYVAVHNRMVAAEVLL
jgi:hypothetical protein